MELLAFGNTGWGDELFIATLMTIAVSITAMFIGFFFAFIKRNKGIVKKEHEFSRTEFDLLFDDSGNFSPPEIVENKENEKRVEE